MRILKIRKNDFFLDKLKKAKIDGQLVIQPFAKPVFPFVGNKSNRRDWLMQLLMKMLPKVQSNVFDVFGGSFYLTHLVQVAAHRLGICVNTFTNDYDDYANLFSPKAMEHLLWYKSVCCDDNPQLRRNELLPDEDCQRIDDYTKRNCPELDQWVIRFLTNYGASRHYRKRLTDHQEFWKGISLRSYIPNTTVTLGKVDWKDWLNWIVERSVCDRNKPSLWIVDPPYTTYGAGIYYGDGFDNLDIELVGIIKKIFTKFPKAYVVSFNYLRNFAPDMARFPNNLHYDELNEYWPACKGLRLRSRPEYVHIWYVGKENRKLDEKLHLVPVIDDRNLNHVRADGKKPGKQTWEYDPFFGTW